MYEITISNAQNAAILYHLSSHDLEKRQKTVLVTEYGMAPIQTEYSPTSKSLITDIPHLKPRNCYSMTRTHIHSHTRTQTDTHTQIPCTKQKQKKKQNAHKYPNANTLS